jgi:uncharacterized membrane protein YdjX (TVP38/TMEM64 family)
VLAVPAINDAMAAAAAASIEAHGWFAATLLGPLSTTPYKLYAILAPHAGAPLLLFAAASVIARLPRFVMASVAVAFVGKKLTPAIGANHVAAVLAMCWLVFYAAYFALNPS